MSPLTIRQTILRILAETKPFAVPTETLLLRLNTLVRPAVAPVDLRGHLTWLLDRSMVDFIPNELAPDDFDARSWLIREAGLTTLMT